jgi:hypothetical protein
MTLEVFFDRALEAFSRVEKPRRELARIGPLQIELNVGPALDQRKWSEPLAFRQAKSDKVDAQFYAWDDSTGSTGFPAPPWGNNYVYTHRGDIKGLSDDIIRVAFNWDSKLLNLWHKERRIGLYWTLDSRTLPTYEWAAPLRTQLHWLGSHHGLQLTHAAAVGLEGRGLLLAGKGGSGKSTTSLACWSAGWQFVSDDYCWVGHEPRTRAYAVYKTAKLLPAASDLPQWERVEHLSSEKNVYQLDQLNRENLVTDLDLCALVLPRPEKVDSPALRPAALRDAQAALSLTTIAQLAGAGPESVAHLRETSSRLDRYHLDLCFPAASIPPLLEGLVAP